MNGKLQNKDYSHIKKWFVVSDVHSYYAELIQALHEKGFEISDTSMGLILCGDAFDRGDQTFEVFNFLKDLASKNRLVYIMGNHEDLLLECLYQLIAGCDTAMYHRSNGTLKTIASFLGEDDYLMYCSMIPQSSIDIIDKKTKPIRDFIASNCVNYFELGDKIFVHSWLPIVFQNGVDKIWPDWHDYQKAVDYDADINALWSTGRWDNPFKLWKQKLYPEDKCIVFGHWHCSWYWSHIKQLYKEWPQNTKKHFQESFQPVIEENIIGLDSCCAYSGFLNCLVFDENGNLLQ